ncbi:EAL domain-containing protein [Paenibacillus sp. GCM10023252]|uniref:EAL domain-containing protein n=1 Tax=Paenibacillus sp. GCM10023252 TaxID=3252649 RepID=UPI00361A2705
MRDLRALVPIHNEHIGWSSLIGVIYLGWHGDHSGGEWKAIDQAGWKRYVTAAAEEEFGRSMLFAGLRWTHHDLFIMIRMPWGQGTLMEGWLLQTARRCREKWEQEYADLQGSTGPLMKLHAGIALLEGNDVDEDGPSWYEATKRAIVHGQTPGAMEHSLRRRAFDRVLANRLINPVYQPILSIKSNEVFGYEALTRCTDSRWFDGPLQLFSYAEQEGMVYALDRLAREKAIDGCMGIKPNQKLFINIMSQIMQDPGFLPGQTLSLLEKQGLSPRNVVFEITERSSIEDFGAVKKVLEHYRSQGYQIAIDDVGAGYSSLQSIVELRPDYIKVDRSLIQNIDHDEMKEHILGTLTELSAKMGISVIAEGIERPQELEQVRAMGVHYAQGYLLGRPASL